MEAMKSKLDEAREYLTGKGGMDQHKVESMSRKEIRQKVRIRHGVTGMFSRIRSGVPTGTTPHFRLWMADLNLRRTLELTPISKLAALSEDPSVTKGYQLLADAGIRNVHQLTQRETLAVAGIGSKRRDALRADLASRNVAVRW